jgi:ATP-binding cassette subfamily C protein
MRDFLFTLYDATRWRLILSILLAALCSLTEGIGILLLIPTLQVSGMSLTGQGKMQSFAESIDVALSWLHLPPSLPVLLGIFLVLISARTVIMKLQMVAGSAVEQRVRLYVREQLHGAIVNADWLFLCRKKSADLVHALTGEIERIATVTVLTLLLAGEILVTFIYTFVAAALAPGVTVMVTGAGLLLAFMLRQRTKAIAGVGVEYSRVNELLYGAIVTGVQNLKATKAYNAELRDQKTFAGLNSAVSRAGNEATRRRALSSGWFEFGSFLILSTAIYASIGLFSVGPASILILLLVFARLMPRIVSGYSHYQGIVNLLPSFDAVTRLRKECEAASEQLLSDGQTVQLRHAIELRNVLFSYQIAAGPVIRGVNLEIKAGQTVAFVGPSGSGKSTLADIIIGLIKPDSGSVTIDGFGLLTSNLPSWRSQIGYVSQDTPLTHDTLRSNLAWARRDVSEEEMWRVLKLAAAEDLVRRLPNGLDTIVGDRGAFLSHGERQRLAIARALLRKPALLVLDEATNSLDSENEERVLEAIDNLHGNLTMLLIAHRFSTLKRADLVYVIEQGKIVASGTWESLASRRDGLEYHDENKLSESVRPTIRQ